LSGLSECCSNPIRRRDDLIACGRRKSTTGQKVVLHIHDDERVETAQPLWQPCKLRLRILARLSGEGNCISRRSNAIICAFLPYSHSGCRIEPPSRLTQINSHRPTAGVLINLKSSTLSATQTGSFCHPSNSS